MAKLLRAFAFLLTLTLTLTACDEEKTQGSTANVTPGVGFISMEATPRQGALPLEVEIVLEVTTKDPQAEVLITVDYGDGDTEDELTVTSIEEGTTDLEILEAAETRRVTFTHIYDDKGTFTVKVDAIDLTNSTDEKEYKALPLSLDITAENLPDLIAVDVSTEITELDVDLPFDITYQIFNNGSDVVTDAGDPRPFDVNIYLVDSPNLPITSLVDSQKAIQLTRRPVQGGLASGSTLTETVGVRIPEVAKPILTQGTWYVAIWVDPDNTLLPALNIVEQDEANNFQISSNGLAAPNLPDLVVSDIHFTNQAEVERLTQIRVDLTLENLGTAASEAFYYDIYLSQSDDVLSPDDIHLALSEHTGRLTQGIEASDTEEISSLVFSIDPPITDPDDFYLIAVVDEAREIEEVDEKNNTLADSDAITVKGETIRDVDIVVEAFSASPSNTYIGGQLDISFDLKNTGTDSSGEFNCEVYLSRDQTLETDADEFQAQFRDQTAPPTGIPSTVARTVFVNVSSAGDYFAFVLCDPSNGIAETDETNNLAGPSAAISVAASPDLDYVPKNLVVSPSSLTEGDSLSFEVDVCNEGTDFAGPVLVEAFLSADATVDINDLSVGLTATTNNALPPGDCEKVTISAPIKCLPFVDTYTAGIIVDASEQIAEGDETNNQLLDTVDGIVIANKDATSNCTCTEDSREGNNDQANASAITLTGTNPKTATLTTLGMCDGVDFFTVNVERGDGIDVKLLNFDPALGDLDLRLYDAINLSQPLLSNGTSNLEQIKHIAADVDATSNVATLYIEVFPKQGGERNSYDLDITVTPKPTKPELQITEIFLTGGKLPNVAVPYNFEVTLFNDGKTDATAFDLDLYLSADTVLDTATDLPIDTLTIPSLTSFQDNVVPVSYDFPDTIQSGVYYIIAEIDAADAVDEADENNNTRVSQGITVDTDCLADAYEGPNGNDTLNAPFRLEAGNNTLLHVSDLNVCDNGRADVYLVCVPAGTQLNHIGVYQPIARYSDSMNLTLLHRDKTPIDDYSSTYNKLLSVYVPDYTCASDASCKGGETCQAGYCADTEGMHCIYAQADLRSSASVTSKDYELFVDAVTSNQSFEPGNDARTGAVKRTDGPDILAEGSGHSAPEDDSDWYYLDLKADTQFDLNVFTGDRNVRAKVYYTGGSSSGTTVSPMTPKSITVNVDERVFFEVYKSVSSTSDDRPSSYSLELLGIDGLDLIPVNLTADLAQATAGDALLLSWKLENTRLTPASNPINYRYWLSIDGTIDPADDFLLDIAGGNGTSKSVNNLDALSSVDILDKVYLNVPISVFGNFNIIVDVDYDNAVPNEESEDNNTDATPIILTHTCLADAYEPNNAFGSATPVTPTFDSNSALGENLSVCSSDADYFSLTVPDGATATFDVTDMVFHNTGDLDIFLYNSAFAEITRSDKLQTASDDTESITWTNSTGAARLVYLRVAPFGSRAGITNIYNLTITTL